MELWNRIRRLRYIINLPPAIVASMAAPVSFRRQQSYLRSAIASDWPAMESGTQSPATTEALSESYRAILKFQSFGTDERLVLAEILRHVDRISEARRERRVMADCSVPAIIWVVLFGGAFLGLALGNVPIGPSTNASSCISLLVMSPLAGQAIRPGRV